MIIGRAFQSNDLNGVISCLKRNYEWMQEKTDREIEEWLLPLRSHVWKDCEIPDDKYPYGKVLVESDRIVGYLGAIGYKRYVEGQRIDFLNLTTWAVDKSVRGGFIPYIEDLFEKPEVIVDLTPNRASVFFEKKFFKMCSYEETLLRFLPVPYMRDYNLQMNWIKSETEIDDEQLRQEFVHHQDNKDVVLVDINNGYSKCCIFYKRMNQKGNWVRVLKVSDPSFFAENCHEISWRIMDKEFYCSCGDITNKFAEILSRSQEGKWICLECDKRFFGNNLINHPHYMAVPTERMYRNNTELDLGILDHLYTEFAVLI